MKTRTLPVYWGGYSPDPYYCSAMSGGYLPECYHNTWLTEDQYQDFYAAGKAARNLSRGYDSGWDSVGIEAFDSTKRKSPHYNNCLHTRYRGVNLPYLAVYCPGLTGYRTQFYRFPFPSLSTMQATPEIVYEYSSAQRRAWWHMQPRFEGEISMLNFLFELKDFRDLAKYVLKADKIRSFRKFGTFVRKHMHDPKFYDPTRPAAAIWLSWHLNWEQLFKDCSTICAQMITLAREAEVKYKRLGTTRQKSHYSEVLYDETDFPASGFYGGLYYNSGGHRRVVFNASMQYHYAYSMRSVTNGFQKYWGLELTADAFWNAIPFSFVADYWLRVSDSLHAMDVDPHTDLRLNEYCESILDVHTQGHHVSPDYGYNKLVIVDGDYHKPPTYPILISGAERSYFRRVRTSPNCGPALPKLHFPSGQNALTMAALVRCLF